MCVFCPSGLNFKSDTAAQTNHFNSLVGEKQQLDDTLASQTIMMIWFNISVVLECVSNPQPKTTITDSSQEFPVDRCLLTPLFTFSFPFLFSLLLSPRLCAYSGVVMCLCSQSPSGSQLSVIYSLISPSRSSLAPAPYGRELRWQLALYHSPEPGQVDTATHTYSEKSTCWRVNKHGRHIIGHKHTC